MINRERSGFSFLLDETNIVTIVYLLFDDELRER